RTAPARRQELHRMPRWTKCLRADTFHLHGLPQLPPGSQTMISRVLASLLLSATVLSACSGGSSVTADIGTDPTTGCTGNCVSAPNSFMKVEDVQKVISQAVAEAQARNVQATIAVIDRVGNVLALYRMGVAANRPTTLVTRTDAAGAPMVSGGLEG